VAMGFPNPDIFPIPVHTLFGRRIPVYVHLCLSSQLGFTVASSPIGHLWPFLRSSSVIPYSLAKSLHDRGFIPITNPLLLTVIDTQGPSVVVKDEYGPLGRLPFARLAPLVMEVLADRCCLTLGQLLDSLWAHFFFPRPPEPGPSTALAAFRYPPLGPFSTS